MTQSNLEVLLLIILWSRNAMVRECSHVTREDKDWKLLGYLYRKRTLSRSSWGLRVKKGHRVLGEEKPFLREQRMARKQPITATTFSSLHRRKYLHQNYSHCEDNRHGIKCKKIILAFNDTWHIWDFHKMWRILCFLETAEHYTMIHGNWLLLVLRCGIKKQI